MPNRTKLLALIFTAIALFIFLAFGKRDSFDPSASRLHTLSRIISNANEGRFAQLEPGVPMENHWEDPGMGIILSAWGMLARWLHIGPVHVRSIYGVQFILIVVLFLLPFSRAFVGLPSWYYPIVPLFILFSIMEGFLYFSWNQYWASSLAAFWAFTAFIELQETFKARAMTISRQCLGTLAVIGFVTGLLALFRRNIHLEVMVTVGLALAVLLARTIRRSANRRQAFFRSALAFAILIVSSALPRTAVDIAWGLRDRAYVIRDMPRNPRHPLWAPLYLGLGYVPNRFGIKWDDGVGFQHVKAAYPNVVYGSEEYEQALKRLYVKAIAEDPILLARNIIRKAITIVGQVGWPLPVVLACLYLALLFWPAAKPLAAGAFLWLSLSIATPLLCFPHFFYYLGFHSGLYLAFGLMIMLFIHEGRRFHVEHALRLRNPRTASFLLAPVLAAAMGAAGLYLAYRFLPYSAPQSTITQFRWISEKGGTFTDREMVSFAGIVDGKQHTYSVDLPDSSAKINAVRLDPSSSYSISFIPDQVVLSDRNGIVTSTLRFNGAEASQWQLANVSTAGAGDHPLFVPQNEDPFVYRNLEPVEATSVKLTMELIARRSFIGWLMEGLPDGSPSNPATDTHL